MDKDFFDNLQTLAKEFATRGEFGEDEVRAEVRLHSGRTYVLDRVVQTADHFVQFDGSDPTDEEKKRISVVVPYGQVNHVQLSRSKVTKREAGFGPA